MPRPTRSHRRRPGQRRPGRDRRHRHHQRGCHHVFAVADFGFADVDAGDTLGACASTRCPPPAPSPSTASQWPPTDVILVADIDAGLLQFARRRTERRALHHLHFFGARPVERLDAAPDTLHINVTPVNDAPAGTDAAVAANEDVAHVFTVANFGFTDVDAGGTPSACASTRCRRRHPHPRRRRRRRHQRDPGATSTPGYSSSPARTRRRALHHLRFLVRDQSNAFDAAPNALRINVTPVNDAPAGTDATVTTNEYLGHVCTVADFGLADVDAGDPERVGIDTLPPPAPSPSTASRWPPPTSSWWPTSTPGCPVHPGGEPERAPYTTFTFSVRDQSNAFDAAPNTLTHRRRPGQRHPGRDNTTVTTNEDVAHVFTMADFGFTDVDAGDTLSACASTRFPPPAPSPWTASRLPPPT